MKMDGDNDGNEIMVSVYHRSGKMHQISKKFRCITLQNSIIFEICKNKKSLSGGPIY
jgi:hypothetical protein